MLPIKITNHKKNLKLGSFLSINVFPCKFCFMMHEDKKSICSQCYGFYMLNRYKRLNSALRFNSDVLSKRILTSYECKDIEKKINGKRDLSGVRFNSIGELINETHIINLQNIAYEIDPIIPITLWTKRPALLFKVIEEPLFKVIQSNPRINTCILPECCDHRITHTFNVYDDEIAMLADIEILKEEGKNTAICHGKCKDCMMCYSHIDHSVKRTAIFELTKRAQRKKDNEVL